MKAISPDTLATFDSLAQTFGTIPAAGFVMVAAVAAACILARIASDLF